MTSAAQKAVKGNPSIYNLYDRFRVGGAQRDMVIAELYYLPPHLTAMLAAMLYSLDNGRELINVLSNRLVGRFMDDRDGKLQPDCNHDRYVLDDEGRRRCAECDLRLPAPYSTE